jgi:adenylate cyclase
MRKTIIFSLLFKLTLFTILLIAASGAIGMTVTAARMRDTLTTEIQEKGVAIAKGMARASEDALVGAGDELYLFQFISSAMKNRGVAYAVIVDETGMVRAHSDIQKSGVKYQDPPGMTKSEDGPGYSIRAGRSPDGEVLYDITVPIVLTGKVSKTLGQVHLGLSNKAIEEAVSKMRKRVSTVGVVALLLGGIGAFTMAKLTVAPIKLLVAGVNEVGRGNLDQEIKTKSNDEIGELTAAFNDMTKGLREKAFIRNTFERYMSKQLAEKLLADPEKLKLELGGENRHVTVLFTDIRGFTSLSEKLDPKGVISFLNEYFSMMVDVVFEHNGWIDKFIGDAIMIIYGLPVTCEDDAVRAVKTGLAMKEAMARYNERRVAEGKGPIHIGIGINTGMVVAGNVGSTERMNYTVIGDEVNIAARLVSLSKQENIIISQNTYEEVKDHFVIEKREKVTLKGKLEPQQIYEVMAENPWRKG